MTYSSQMALDAVVLDPRSNEGRASKMERILRLIEGLQTLAGLICTADEPISEHDRVMLAKLLNEGASPADAARHVARARISLH